MGPGRRNGVAGGRVTGDEAAGRGVGMKADAECAASTTTAGTFQEDIITSSSAEGFPLYVENFTGGEPHV